MALILVISDVLLNGTQVDQGTIIETDQSTADHLVTAKKAMTDREAMKLVAEKALWKHPTEVSSS
jgi:hypothetical protein